VDALQVRVLREFPTRGKGMGCFVGILAGGFAVVPVDAPGGEVVVPRFTSAGNGLDIDRLTEMVDEVGSGHAEVDGGFVGFGMAGAASEEQAKQGDKADGVFHSAS